MPQRPNDLWTVDEKFTTDSTFKARTESTPTPLLWINPASVTADIVWCRSLPGLLVGGECSSWLSAWQKSFNDQSGVIIGFLYSRRAFCIAEKLSKMYCRRAFKDVLGFAIYAGLLQKQRVPGRVQGSYDPSNHLVWSQSRLADVLATGLVFCTAKLGI